jgi:hypothetical protein
MTQSLNRLNLTPDEAGDTVNIFDKNGRIDPVRTDEANKVILNTIIFTDSATQTVQSTVKSIATPVVHVAATKVARAATKKSIFG